AWRTYTIPSKGEPGNETWKDGKDHWMHGGASVWVTATYDKDTDTIYQGIGNAGPDYDAEYRPGDNKWAASVLALDPNNGNIKWGFQYMPNDPYDYGGPRKIATSADLCESELWQQDSQGGTMGQFGFFDADRRLAAITAKGDPLEMIARVVPFESFRAEI